MDFQCSANIPNTSNCFYNLYATYACNWLEIDSLANLLCVRWSRQPGACVTVDKEGVKTLSMDSVTETEAETMHGGVPTGKTTSRIWDYNDVNSVDVTYSTRRDAARAHPFITLGYWSIEAELSASSCMFYYNVENPCKVPISTCRF